MNGMNKAILIGVLGADPELKITANGNAVMRLRMATSETYLDKASGERQEKTEWHTVVMWGKRAESLNKLLSKGSKLAVEGSIQTRSWEDKDGGKRYATEINARDIILLGDARKGGGEQRRAQQEQTSDEGFGGGGGAVDMDDLPFGPVGDIG